MTDNEIKNALECCIKNTCLNCPAKENYNVGYTKLCMSCLYRDVFDLINRQQAEIEELKSAMNCYRPYEEEQIAEAIKEFAERLKGKKQLVKANLNDIGECLLYGVLCGDIDNLVKKMVGEE